MICSFKSFSSVFQSYQGDRRVIMMSCAMEPHCWCTTFTVKILNIGTCMSEQTVYILIRLLLRRSLIRIYTVCHSFCIFWMHYFLVKLNCFILRTTTVAGLGVPIFRVFTVSSKRFPSPARLKPVTGRSAKSKF